MSGGRGGYIIEKNIRADDGVWKNFVSGSVADADRLELTGRRGLIQLRDVIPNRREGGGEEPAFLLDVSEATRVNAVPAIPVPVTY
jgi:hypothetical protein